MDDRRLDKIETSIETVHTLLHRMDLTLVRQEENLREIMRRTEAAESGLKNLKNENNNTRQELLSEIDPIKKHVNGFAYVFKVLGALAFVAGLIISAAKVYELIQPKAPAAAAAERSEQPRPARRPPLDAPRKR